MYCLFFHSHQRVRALQRSGPKDSAAPCPTPSPAINNTAVHPYIGRISDVSSVTPQRFYLKWPFMIVISSHAKQIAIRVARSPAPQKWVIMMSYGGAW